MHIGKKNSDIVHILICFFYISMVLDFITAYKYTYVFKRNKNSEILFFEEKTEKMVVNKERFEDIEFKILLCSDSNNITSKNPIFIYTKENFIEFEILNNFLYINSAKNQHSCGVIECNFELPYILKLTKDITEITNKPTTYTFISLLTFLSRMKAAKNKKVRKLLQELMFINLFHQNIYPLKNNDLNFDFIFKSGFFTGIDISTKINLISGFLNIFMIKFTFYDDNLILLDNSNEYYDTSLFNEHIPYKNLLINNNKVFYDLENILQKTYILNIFQILLNILDINSLILNNNIGFKFSNMDFQFLIPLLANFMSISISNFTKDSSFLFLEKISKVINDDICYLSLRNILVWENTLLQLLRKESLKGLVLQDVRTIENVNTIENYTISNKNLDYIEYSSVKLNIILWNNYFQTAKFGKIILIFYTSKAQEFFVQEFSNFRSYLELLYFKVKFFNFKLSVEFCEVLVNLTNLKTLRLNGYISYVNTESFLLNAIGNMVKLEYLHIQQPFFSVKNNHILFKIQKLKTLILENVFLQNETPFIHFFNNYKFFIKLALIRVKICLLDLEEIMKLENLLDLSIELCKIEHIRYLPKPQYIIPRNIISLYFSDTNLEIMNYLEFLSNLDHLEKLYISNCNLIAGCIGKLSLMCNKILKTLSYQFGTLNSKDLNRIEKFEVLQELDLYRCTFQRCSFHNLGSNCKFFNSLKSLDLFNVNINIEDLEYFMKFKNLKKISLKLSGLDLLKIKHFLVSLPIYQVIINDIRNEILYKKIRKYLHEENIDILQDYL
ncbi:hypothetical protein LUQ84_001659 [Hamiltosporidium tvaerminnensis]|nr:hypothetical protein LUQ84_001659 [Hamiltosporidium tvaerminnensis]